MPHHFDSDTKALKRREDLNVQGALYNLENWIIQQTNPHKGIRILDLGCGTGKQIFAFADIVSTDGLILGIDISDEAINEINKKAKIENLKQIKAMKASIDNCIELLKDFRFDFIMSAYAIYYAKDMRRLLCRLRYLLNAKGQMFICGPGEGTNKEMISIINDSNSDSTAKARPVKDFIKEGDIREINNHYSKVKTVRLANQVRFNSANSILQWWKNHNSFIPEIYDDVAKALKSHFKKNKIFVLTKNVMGVHFYA